MEPGSDVSIVPAYFTIYAYETLRVVLVHACYTRFPYYTPRSVGALDSDRRAHSALAGSTPAEAHPTLWDHLSMSRRRERSKP